MRGALPWSTASELRSKVAPREQAVLRLLSRMPLLWADAISCLGGPPGKSAAYACLHHLRDRGMVLAVHVPLAGRLSPRLHYLSDLGLAVTALEQGLAPQELARRYGLHRSGLYRALAGLPELLLCYEAAVRVAPAGTGTPEVVEWERPWRRSCGSLRAKHPITVRLPAYLEVSCGEESRRCLILPDLEAVPVRSHGQLIARVLDYRNRSLDPLPVLLVYVGEQDRAGRWEELLHEVAANLRDEPLRPVVLTRSDPPPSLDLLDAPTSRDEGGLLLTAPPVGPVPRLVGRLAAPHTVRKTVHAGQLVLAMSPADWQLLDLIGRHALLDVEQIATVQATGTDRVRRRCARMVRIALLRCVEDEELGLVGAGRYLEATGRGVRLLSGWYGLSRRAAVKWLGLSGGGPDEPVGTRRQLMRQAEHTLGVNSTFVGLFSTAAKWRQTGADHDVEEWRSEAAVSRSWMRPDGYGVYRIGGTRYGFFLEYDRGTMKPDDYDRKFRAFYEWRGSARFTKEYDLLPTMLVVTDSPASEERISQAALSSSGLHEPLPVLLTTAGRVCADQDGMLGCIWRTPGNARRRYWPEGAPAVYHVGSGGGR